MILRRKVMPSMFGISTSSVTTSGFSVLMRSRAIYGSPAVPTTSISGSDDSNVDNKLTDQRGVVDNQNAYRFSHDQPLIAEQFDLARRCARRQTLCMLHFLPHHRTGCIATQKTPHDFSIGRRIVDATGETSAEILRNTSQPSRRRRIARQTRHFRYRRRYCCR